MLLRPPHPLPARETLFEFIAQSSGGFSFPLLLTTRQLAIGVRLLINGLQQKPGSFTATQSRIIIPSNLEVMTGDILHIQYYEAL